MKKATCQLIKPEHLYEGRQDFSYSINTPLLPLLFENLTWLLHNSIMTQKYHLAQINIARLLAPIDDPIIQEFVDNLDPINALADAALGFVWRLQTEDGNATDIQVVDDPLIIVNMSVWENVETLKKYTYQSDHVKIMRRRKEWFEKIKGLHMVMWWIPEGQTPTPQDGMEKLAYLQEHGETAVAFTFKTPFAPPND